MYLVVGLGNPGIEFSGSRHNAGFELINELAERNGIKVIAKEHMALTGLINIAGQDVLLAMPQTYMNLSGRSVSRLVQAYHLDPTSELIVAYDDINLDLGRLRIRKKGSAGGHNGMKDIIASLGTEGFTRVRIGVGNKISGMDLKDFVLGKFEGTDEDTIKESVELAADAIEMIITSGADAAMNKYNPYTKAAEEDAKERQERRDLFEAELLAARMAADEIVNDNEEGFEDPEEYSKPYRYYGAEDLKYKDDDPDDVPAESEKE